MSVCRELGTSETSPERYTHLLIKACRHTVSEYSMTDILSSPMQHNWSSRCSKQWKHICWPKWINSFRVDKSFFHCEDMCKLVSTHVHTQIHIHSDFLLRVSVYVSVLGLWYVLSLRHTRTGPLQDVRRVWCSSKLILPQTPRHIQDIQHTHTVEKESCILVVYSSLNTEDIIKMWQRWSKHVCCALSTNSFIHNTTHSHI